MIWNSPADFFAMGGYAFYVWGSFGACALAMIVEPWLATHRRTTILNSLSKLNQDNNE
ncbi:MAG: heme exporter protein CcmD [Rhodocyclaceae bacterium]|nr:heme exporter protein CcmD [Rhodocyclaceae bacterium]